MPQAPFPMPARRRDRPGRTLKKPFLGKLPVERAPLVSRRPVRSALCAALALLYLSLGCSPAHGGIKVPIVGPSEAPPQGWKVKDWKGKARFEVIETEFGSAIHLKSSGTSSALYKKLELDVREYPYLSWRWKVTSLPAGADVRLKEKDDQAAQVYVVFPRWPAAVNSRLVGYIWDTSAPQGLMVQSAKTENTRYIVIRSGPAGTGEWVRETRNVYEDYKELFKDDPPRMGSVSVMIDSDDTESSAESFIGDFIFSMEPPSK